jgi:starch phosphorylase
MTVTRSAPAALPARISGLAGLATNLAWSWHRDARALFRAVDALQWHTTRHNPIELLERVSAERLAACAADPAFLRRYDALMESMTRYLDSTDTWFGAEYPSLTGQTVAYFCAEFGLHNSVPIYSGGLGVLAGDHCKAASDLGVPLIAVGLFYTKGYFDQRIRLDGWQEDSDEQFDPAITPLTPVTGPDGDPSITTVRIAGRQVAVGAWKMLVGRVTVFLLDTDFERNEPGDRELSAKLYGGGSELRLRQEILLGIGGVRVLRTLGITPTAWHANEGHATLMLVERLREQLAGGASYEEAVSRVRASSVFTTHTPVPAGHDRFPHGQFEAVAGPLWEDLGVERERVWRLGRHPDGDDGQFHMTVAAIRLSGRVLGVAARHGEVTRRMWSGLWPGRETVPIRHITNGVHVTTWIAHPMKTLLDTHLGADWDSPARAGDRATWERVLALDDAQLWDAHLRLKTLLLDFLRDDARERGRQRWQDTAHFVAAGTLLTARTMTIGFSRRFAAYKRADLVFRDVDRLARIVTNPRRPVQIIVAGKAHPADDWGKRILQTVYTHTRDPRFQGRIAFLEDYELHAAHRLVQGVDLWLNLPRPPLEACGTSGMKAALNGVPQLSTLDGWWEEGFARDNGWALPPTGPDEDGDAVDAERLYALLESEVVPLFYDQDGDGLPRAWIARMKQAIRVAGTRFTAQRMVQEYVRGCYAPAMRGISPEDPPPAD